MRLMREFLDGGESVNVCIILSLLSDVDVYIYVYALYFRVYGIYHPSSSILTSPDLP